MITDLNLFYVQWPNFKRFSLSTISVNGMYVIDTVRERSWLRLINSVC